MQTDVLIIGQGICGTLLSWFLYKAGKTFVVVDEEKSDTPSKVAAGIINPVTGRRFVYSWMIDTVMPFAVQVYQELGYFLNKKIISRKNIIDFFPSAQMRDAFLTRLTENDTYLHTYPNQHDFNPVFQYDFGCGQISPAYITDLQTLLEQWRHFIQKKDWLRSEPFHAEELKISSDALYYQHITAHKIVFCDGIGSMNRTWFQALPFSPSKGEVLLIESKDLSSDHIYKKGMMLAPLAIENLFWVGSSYQWEYEHAYPTTEFYQQAKNHLDGWLKVSYKIVDHKAALRPSTLERRPFVGFHPVYHRIGLLNGMGTKGTSLAPFFAHQLVQHLLWNAPITEEASISRFSRILSSSVLKK